MSEITVNDIILNMNYENMYRSVYTNLNNAINKKLNGEKVLFTDSGLMLMEKYYPDLYKKSLINLKMRLYSIVMN